MDDNTFEAIGNRTVKLTQHSIGNKMQQGACISRKIIVTCNPKTNPLGSMTLLPAYSSHLLTSFGFTQPDPMADSYTWLSPYAYCAADPINLIDPTGRSLTVTGDSAVAVVDILNTAMGRETFYVREGELCVIDSFDLDGLSETQLSLYNCLNEIIIDQEIHVELNVVYDDDDVDIGNKDMRAFDLADALILASSGLTSVESIFSHEAYEQYKFYQNIKHPVKGKNPWTYAHYSAIGMERSITGLNYFMHVDKDGRPGEYCTHYLKGNYFIISIQDFNSVSVYEINMKTGKRKSPKIIPIP